MNTVQSTTFTGVIWYRSQVGLKQIPDGSSKVYLIGEKYLDTFTALHTGPYGGNGDEESVYHGFSPALIRLAGSGGAYCNLNAPVATPSATSSVVSQYNYPLIQDAVL